MNPVLFSLSAASDMAAQLCAQTGIELGDIVWRQFPDGESYVRFITPIGGRDVVLLCTLNRPDTKAMALLFAAAEARDLGARRVGLIAPYLAYMRQDKAFNEGEAVTSVTFGRLLSRAFDALITVDPHLHRHPDLNAIYSIPAIAVTAGPAIAEWIRRKVTNPLIIGPDEESAQWVDRIARLAGAPSAVLRKERKGDYDVSISAENLPELRDVTPVVIDDIASSARTMIEAVHILRRKESTPPIAVVVHPIFAGEAYAKLQAAGAERIVSTDTIVHPSNAISVSPYIATALGKSGAVQTTRSQESSSGRPQARRKSSQQSKSRQSSKK